MAAAGFPGSRGGPRLTSPQAPPSLALAGDEAGDDLGCAGPPDADDRAQPKARPVRGAVGRGRGNPGGAAISHPAHSPWPPDRQRGAALRFAAGDDRGRRDPISHPPRRAPPDPQHRAGRGFHRLSRVLFRACALFGGGNRRGAGGRHSVCQAARAVCRAAAARRRHPVVVLVRGGDVRRAADRCRPALGAGAGRPFPARALS